MLSVVEGGHGTLGIYRSRASAGLKCDNKSIYEGDCDPPPSGEFLVGPGRGPLRPVLRAPSPAPPSDRCKKRLFVLEDAVFNSGPTHFDGRLLIYFRRIRCLRPRLSPSFDVVVQDVRTGKSFVVHKGVVERVLVAGRYAAVESADGSDLIVIDIVRRRPVLRVDLFRVSDFSDLALGADGTVIIADLPGAGARARLFAVSPSSPRPVRLEQDAFCPGSCPLMIAGGRFAFERYRGEDSYDLAIGDLRGRTRTIASFDGKGRYTRGFDFDGRRIAWVTGYDRPYRGKEDAGLEVNCNLDGSADVIVEAPVVHTMDVTAEPTSRLPTVPAPRTFTRKRPDCPRD